MSASRPLQRVRVVVAGMGDTGLLTAVTLSRYRRLVDVVAVSSKPGLLSGQDLGWRLARPDQWSAQNNIPFGRYRALDRVRLVHGSLTGLDPTARSVTVLSAEGATIREPYDVLVLATGYATDSGVRPTCRAGPRSTRDCAPCTPGSQPPVPSRSSAGARRRPAAPRSSPRRFPTSAWTCTSPGTGPSPAITRTSGRRCGRGSSSSA